MTKAGMARRRAVRSADGRQRAVAYLRVSTAEQFDSGLGLAAQCATVAAETGRRLAARRDLRR